MAKSCVLIDTFSSDGTACKLFIPIYKLQMITAFVDKRLLPLLPADDLVDSHDVQMIMAFITFLKKLYLLFYFRDVIFLLLDVHKSRRFGLISCRYCQF